MILQLSAYSDKHFSPADLKPSAFSDAFIFHQTFFLLFFIQDCISFQDTDLLQMRNLPFLDLCRLLTPLVESDWYELSPAALGLKKV